jgi:RNA polymerase sigma factor (sigma-70 family)
MRSTVATGGARSDEQLVAQIRRGQRHAFDTLASRYQARLLRFCWQILRSKEDAEDALQDVLAAAFTAILADNREIYVRPWLYRIARNRCINQLRRATAVSTGTMDEHHAENGRTLVETVLRRQAFRELICDVQQLPDSQRTALLLREIDGFSYLEIAFAMRTTVPSVKSLLVRARAGLVKSTRTRSLTHAAARDARERGRARPDEGTISYQSARACARIAA